MRREVHTEPRLPPPPRGWLVAFSRRPHTHDVRTLAIYEPHVTPSVAAASCARGASAANGGGAASRTALLVSGGIDTQLCLLSLGDFERAQPLKLLPFPQRGAIGLARDARLLLSHDTAQVHVWQLPALPLVDADRGCIAPAGEGAADEAGSPRKLLLLRPKLVSRTISCAAISDGGSWLVVCDSETRLYKLTLVPEASASGAASTMAVERVPLPEDVEPAGCCAFSPDERLLLLGGLDGLVQTVTLGEAAPAVHTLRSAPGHEAAANRCAFVQICISPDAQWIATADCAHRVHVHSVDGLCFSSAMPPLSSPPTALAFLPASSLLAVALANKQLSLYDVDRSVFVPWSARHAGPIAAVAASPEVPHRIAVNPARPLAPVLCSQSWLCRVELDIGAAGDETGGGESGNGSKRSKAKRRRAAAAAPPAGAEESEGTCELAIRNYGGMLLFAILSADEAVVVEQPWLRVMDHFPPALFRHRFGT